MPTSLPCERLGASLRCAHGVLHGTELDQLQGELSSMPRALSWGRTGDSKMALSKRKFFHLDATAMECVTSGGDGVSRRALEADLAACPPCVHCTPALAARVAAHIGLHVCSTRMARRFQMAGPSTVGR